MSRCRKLNRYQQLTFDECGDPVPPPRRHAVPAHKRGQFEPECSPEEAAAVIRGALADILENGFTSGDLGYVLWNGNPLPEHAGKLPPRLAKLVERTARFVEKVCDLGEEGDRIGVVRALRSYGLSVYQAISETLFPEIFDETDLTRVGLFPAGEVERVGPERVRAMAAAIRARNLGVSRAKPKSLADALAGKSA